MFSVGQTVYHKAGKHQGKVVECDGDTVYLTTANGVEMDFRQHELTATPPAGKAAVPTADPVPSRTLTDADITAEHHKVLAVIPQRTLQSVVSLYERRPRRAASVPSAWPARSTSSPPSPGCPTGR